MALITRSKYGLVAVNNDVVKSIISKCIMEHADVITPCSRRGKVYKKGFLGGDPSIMSSIEIFEDKSSIELDLYYVIKFGESINDTTNLLFDLIEYSLSIIKLPKPRRITAHIKGVVASKLVARDIEVERINEE